MAKPVEFSAAPQAARFERRHISAQGGGAAHRRSKGVFRTGAVAGVEGGQPGLTG